MSFLKKILRYAVVLAVLAGSHPAYALAGVEGLKWGQTPQEVVNAWNGKFEFDRQPEDPLGRAVYELRYKGNFMGTYDGVISAIFYLNRLFAVAVSYGSGDSRPASEMFEELVAKMAGRYGPYKKKSAPQELHSYVATPDVPFIAQMPNTKGQRLDMQIRTGFWIPEATWSFPNGASIRVLIQKGPDKPGSMPALSPLLLFSKPNLLE